MLKDTLWIYSYESYRKKQGTIELTVEVGLLYNITMKRYSIHTFFEMVYMCEGRLG